jgi:hypothetical protein
MKPHAERDAAAARLREMGAAVETIEWLDPEGAGTLATVRLPESALAALSVETRDRIAAVLREHGARYVVLELDPPAG